MPLWLEGMFVARQRLRCLNGCKHLHLCLAGVANAQNSQQSCLCLWTAKLPSPSWQTTSHKMLILSSTWHALQLCSNPHRVLSESLIACISLMSQASAFFLASRCNSPPGLLLWAWQNFVDPDITWGMACTGRLYWRWNCWK